MPQKSGKPRTLLAPSPLELRGILGLVDVLVALPLDREVEKSLVVGFAAGGSSLP